MKLSAALCTYNGARHLRAQLDSIAAQQRPPDELVVCDDASRDDSAQLAERFARAAPFEVRVLRSTANVGTTKNFERAVAACRGDVIALSDQDDVWLPHRLQHIEEAFTHRPALTLAFADAYVVDESLQPRYRLWQALPMGHARRRRIRGGEAFVELLRSNFVTGATMAIAARVWEAALPIPALQTRLHDGWLALIAGALGPMAMLPEPAIYYRQHPAQQAGAAALPDWDARVQTLLRKREFAARADYTTGLADLEVLEQRLAALALPAAVRHVQQFRRHAVARAGIPRGRLARWPVVCDEVFAGRYRYSSGWRSILRDLLLN